MSVRPYFVPYPVIDAESMGVNITSDVTIIQKLSMPSYSYSWTGTSPVGTISVQISNDYSQNADGSVKNAGTWTSIFLQVDGAGLVDEIPVSGNTGSGFVDVPITGAYAIRTIYNRTSGTGTLTSYIAAKVS